MRRFIFWLVLLASASLVPDLRSPALGQEDKAQVDALNAFSDTLLKIVDHWQKTGAVSTSERIGGYARLPDFYREVEYRNATTGRLVARVRRVREAPELAQMIELFLHDEKGDLIADYFVSYLVEHRNAPLHALISLHAGQDGLRAFRQFDIFGDQTYENCRGRHAGEPVDISIDSYAPSLSVDQVPAALYDACFGMLPEEPGEYARPVSLLPGTERGGDDRTGAGVGRAVAPQARLRRLDRAIAAAPRDPDLLVKRGDAYFELGDMEKAAKDYHRALQLDGEHAGAYFGRGMALGRLGRLDDAIADLTQFINRNPNSSIGYTKRGVRRIWKRDFEGAIGDLETAVSLDQDNAEAHDDLGVALAQTGRLDAAVEHLLKARAIDPGYRKVHHNLAMVFYLTGDLEGALGAVNDAIELSPDTKSTVLLKSTILEALGRADEARRLRERARMLPAGDWSERSPIQ